MDKNVITNWAKTEGNLPSTLKDCDRKTVIQTAETGKPPVVLPTPNPALPHCPEASPWRPRSPRISLKTTNLILFPHFFRGENCGSGRKPGLPRDVTQLVRAEPGLEPDQPPDLLVRASPTIQ